jgi:hypothetical protein
MEQGIKLLISSLLRPSASAQAISQSNRQR